MTGQVFTLSGDPDIEVNLRRSARARRLSLRVSSLDGRVTLTMPTYARTHEAIAFAEERRDWIASAQSRAPSEIRVALGTTIPVENVARMVAAGTRPSLEDDRLLVKGRRAGPAARAFLKVLARERLVLACDRHAATLGLRYPAISLRDTRSRWGSCTSEGRLMFSWRLIMAPPVVLDYVAAHEVAHLKRMDHSAAFWEIVADLCPDWQRHRGWLHRQGADLHRYKFDD